VQTGLYAEGEYSREGNRAWGTMARKVYSREGYNGQGGVGHWWSE